MLRPVMNSRTLEQTGNIRQLALIPEIFPDLVADADGDHGEVFTRKWVVQLILDLGGYTIDRDLGEFLAAEPACGTGALLCPMGERLTTSRLIHAWPITD